MFKLVQKLGKFVVKMYHKEADKLDAKSKALFETAQATDAQALNLTFQANEHRQLAVGAGNDSKAVRAKAKALEGLF